MFDNVTCFSEIIFIMRSVCVSAEKSRKNLKLIKIKENKMYDNITFKIKSVKISVENVEKM